MSQAAVIAVDGPAGSGKSSVCRGVASRLGFRYLDTGAMYRALTWAVLERGVDPNDAVAVAEVAAQASIDSGYDPAAPTIFADGVDVSGPIREQRITSAVSAVSAVPAAREALVRRQREHAENARQAGKGIVVEGRDITTVVLPDADLKVFLTADEATRAARRSLEQGAADATSVAQTQRDLARRDQLDSSRATSPLTQSADATVVDTTHLTLAEVIDYVIQLSQGEQHV